MIPPGVLARFLLRTGQDKPFLSYTNREITICSFICDYERRIGCHLHHLFGEAELHSCFPGL
jgi:hypothetical protein